jgi:hypothetical protein
LSDIAFTAPLLPPAAAGPREAIAHAARTTGVDFDFLLAQAKLESGLDPAARARTSSAAGLYQFTRGTWLDTLRKHGAEHGLGWTGTASADPSRRAEIMALRHQPQVAALMAAELAGDNAAALSASLGREPDHAELYLAHFLGIGGATRFLSALAADPAQPAAAILPEAARANRAIFMDQSGAPRSVEGVMALVRSRMANALEGGAGSSEIPAGGNFTAAAAAWSGTAALPPVPAMVPRPSMADTLRQAFNVGGSGEGGAPGNVTYAYRRLAALGL